MLTLLPLLGLSWVLSLLVPYSVVFHYFFVIANTVQGMCIFFLHCICNAEVSGCSKEIIYRGYWLQWRKTKPWDVTIYLNYVKSKHHLGKVGLLGVKKKRMKGQEKKKKQVYVFTSKTRYLSFWAQKH